MERKIGEIFEYNGEWHQTVKSQGKCCSCDFMIDGHCIVDFSSNGSCFYCHRKDKENVIFKKLEKVGEPYMDGGKIMQKYKRVYQEPIYFPYKELNCYNDLHGRICIEIKQNKEDMEEKKVYLKSEDVDFLRRKFKEITEDYIIQGCDKDKVQREFGKLFSVIEEKHSNSENIGKNLREFDLEAAKAGKPVCTRDGRKARIICFDVKGDICPIIALVEKDNIEVTYRYNENGQNAYSKSELDLMMLPEKKEGWVNLWRHESGTVHPDGNVYSSKEEAVKIGSRDYNYVDTVKIEWEE